ncbi:hypothetical protein ES708_33587 [subsurface metagenome]
MSQAQDAVESLRMPPPVVRKHSSEECRRRILDRTQPTGRRRPMPDASLQERFLSLWDKHFDGAELPLCLLYCDDPGAARPLVKPAGHVCMIGVPVT